MEVKTPAPQGDNPFDLTIPLPLLIARFVGVAVMISGVISGVSLLQWMSVPVLLWIVLVIRGRHVLFAENLREVPHLAAGAARSGVVESLSPVALIAPARNEEFGIEAGVRALAALEYPGLEILLVDDHSTDGTLGILRQLASEFPRLSILTAPDIPDGWNGKNHAAWFAFLQSSPAARWLLFTDSRVIFHPTAVSRAVAHAEANRLDFLSCVIRYDGKSLAEELIALVQNRDLVVSTRSFGGGAPDSAFGVGQFMLVRRDMYAGSRGHALFPSHPIEDFVLARTVHREGGKTSAAIAPEILSLRRYHRFADMRQRIVRSIRLAASDRVPNLLSRISVELLFGILPLPLAIAGLVLQILAPGWKPALTAMSVLALSAYLAGVSTPRSCLRVCLCRRWVVWLYPLGSALWAWFVLLALTEAVRGQAISWRGRTIHAPVPPGNPVPPP
jgi:hypothetical protein